MLKISLIIPAYNEAERIGGTIFAVKKYFDASSYEYEIIVVDDGSTDDTAQEVRKAGLEPLRLKKNGGKGAAVRAGIEAALGDVIAFTDADLPYDLSLIFESASKINGGADIVIGSRQGGGYQKYGLMRKACSGAFSLISNAFLHLDIKDTQCGFKVFRSLCAKELFGLVTVGGFGFDIEVLYIAKKLGYRIETVSAHMMAPPVKSSVHPVRDGLDMLLDIFEIRKNDRRGVYSRAVRENNEKNT